MDYRRIGTKIKQFYNQAYSRRYREADELAVDSEDHKHYCSTLKKICRSFGHKISALDIGCGTGRYFHCLENVKRLTGIDISPHMLEEAHNPVNKADIRIGHIDLICTNIFEADIAAGSFDFIYSIGVLGEHYPFDLYICNRLFDLLKPGGKLFLTVVDIFSNLESKGLKGHVAKCIYQLGPSILKRYFKRRWKSFYMTDIELKDIMENSKFAQYVISRRVAASPFWKGAHYECITTKDTRSFSNAH